MLMELKKTRTAKGFMVLSIFYFVLIIPINFIVTQETNWVRKFLFCAWSRTSFSLIMGKRSILAQ